MSDAPRFGFIARCFIARLGGLALVCFTLGFLALGEVVPTASAGDWPQVLGPQRNGRAEGESLLASWPADGPRTLWQYELGGGYAGPAVVDGRVVVFHRHRDVERVEALDAANGRQLWKADFPAYYRGGANSDLGPRCVPLIHQARVYVFGAAGDLYCVSLTDGKKIWSRSAYADFGGKEGYFGAGSTPIVADGKLLLNVGGNDGAGLVAFALKTGKTVWKSTDEAASYSSPTLATIDGRQHVIFLTRLNAVSVDPSNGRVRFSFPFGQRGPTVNAATPLVFDNHLFVSASYGVGARLSRIANDRAEKVWSNDKVMSSQYTTCVFDRGYLYGADGREDVGSATLRCLDAKTGKPQWSVKRFGVAHVIIAGGRLLILRVDGRLSLAEATPQEYRELSSAAVLDATARALPALCDGRLFVRNTQRGGGTLKCLVVGKTPSQ